MTTPTDHTADTVLDDPVLDDPGLDEDWLAAPRPRSRLRLALAATLAAAMCFLGGVLVQQHFGTTTTSSPSAGLPTGLAGAAPEGFPGNLPNDGAAPTGSDRGAGASDDSTSVIGTVVSVRGDVWVVEDLGGKRHRVHLDDGTDLLKETTIDPDAVRVGDGVDIDGTTDGDLLEAEQVTLR